MDERNAAFRLSRCVCSYLFKLLEINQPDRASFPCLSPHRRGKRESRIQAGSLRLLKKHT